MAQGAPVVPPATGASIFGGVEPSRHVRVVLTEARRQGLTFKEAWGVAVQSLPRTEADRQEVLDDLAWARPAFQAGYERSDYAVTPTGKFSSVLSVVAAVALDGVPAGDQDAPPPPDAARLNGDDGSHQAPPLKASSAV